MSHEWVVQGLEADLDHFHLGPVDLTLAPGNAVAVLGASGAGKTTLLRTLAGFLRLRRGQILRDGVDISGWLPEERNLGYVPQGLGLFPHRTVARNIRYPMEIRDRAGAEERTKELLEQFRLTPLANRYPSRLSGGEQQRVALARALAADPGLIVWDEPWQGLDVLARYELGLVLHELRQAERVPMVVVTHDPTLAFSIADSFLVLRTGQVREQCDAATLLRAPADPFAARFVGFENVFDPEALAKGPPGSLRAFLRERSGSEGVAFASPSLGPLPVGIVQWQGTVRSARPNPHGFTVEVLVDGLVISVRIPPPMAPPLPVLGDTVRFGIEPATVQPLGTSFT
ncbi:MAG: ATP-binding cassette domain-containing protein [Thermoplasmata archaeon]|nr:ATP-binding cassette domain-containing protein [Thermoplasmata archaeon]MCI4333742.1 ATP-binding cassette domain-containing protein [Thermoplasmata archaeon]MCI4367530.1 ATP-binding cassette domain-containing protein [Thermoplasmata archaeon]